MRILALAAAALLVDGTKVQMDWGAALRTDATAMHDAIAVNHPGPVNPADPGFSARNDAQLERALRRARTAKSFADYFYAMQQYSASFNDGHLSYGVWRSTPDVVQRWPGFLTRYDAGGHQTVVISEPWSGVPLGARLLSCDGRSADEVARDRVGSRVGRWALASQRELFGAMTFLDVGDPYVGTIQRCRFDEGGDILEVTLKWQAPKQDLYRYVFLPPINREVTHACCQTGRNGSTSHPSTAIPIPRSASNCAKRSHIFATTPIRFVPHRPSSSTFAAMEEVHRIGLIRLRINFGGQALSRGIRNHQ